MSVWEEMVGQDEAVSVLRAAASGTAADGTSSLTHAWLLTGPPGSGRSNLAYAFATALLSGVADGDDATASQVRARSHPDLVSLATEGSIIKVADIKDAVRRSYYAPSIARYRVVVVEDADRIDERSSNVLLKALEEPPAETIWVLCAPSEADMLPTIRSRVRSVRLKTPTVDAVTQLLVTREGIDPALAAQSARLAQSHIGMARRLATNPQARSRREATLRAVLEVRDVADAVVTASHLVEWAGEDAKAVSGERDERERENLLRSFGIASGGTLPPALRSQLRALEDDQKRRAKRGITDGVDRIFTDVLSLYRDVLLTQLGRTDAVINTELSAEIGRVTADTTPAHTLRLMDNIHEARTRIERNVSPQLAIEAMLVSAIR